MVTKRIGNRPRGPNRNAANPLPGSITRRLAVVCAGQKAKLPAYVLDEALPTTEPAKPPKLPPPPPLDPEEIRRLSLEFSDHEDPPFYYDPASGAYHE